MLEALRSEAWLELPVVLVVLGVCWWYWECTGGTGNVLHMAGEHLQKGGSCRKNCRHFEQPEQRRVRGKNRKVRKKN